jgi:hypothetical protein
MTFKEWIVDIFKDERGSISIKPVIAIIGTLFLCVTMSINAFSKKACDPSEALVNAIVVVTAIGMGADSLDKFSHKSPIEDSPKTK